MPRGTPSRARFRGEERDFDSAKDAYVFLVDRFLRANPELLDFPYSDELAITLSSVRKQFARDVDSLFEKSQHLALDPNNYTQVASGWFANLNTKNEQKVANIYALSALGRFKLGEDWSWDLVPPSDPHLLDLI